MPQTNKEEVQRIIADYEVLVLNSKISVTREIIDEATRLKLVMRAGVGMDHIDEAYLEEKGILVKNATGANADAVGEHAVGMLLVLMRHILRADRQVRQYTWWREENRGKEIKGSTVGIIGYGHTGKAVARKLSGFGARVLAYDKYLHDYSDAHATEASMETIFAEADICTVHIPLTDETRELVTTAFFGKFAKPIYFLNLARGPIANIEAVLKGLEEGRLLGAGLDVLPQEPLNKLSPAQKIIYDNLFYFENVVFTPHIGGWTVESALNIQDLIIREIEAIL